MALKPMHEYYASYDLYGMMWNLQKCTRLKDAYTKCRRVFPNPNLGTDHCAEKFKLWQEQCDIAQYETQLHKNNITSSAPASMAEKPVS